jgi:hypothetical protein
MAFLLISLSIAAMNSAASQTPHHPEHAGFACRGDEKVWVNTRSGIDHLSGERYYGSTKDENTCAKRRPMLRVIARPATGSSET